MSHADSVYASRRAHGRKRHKLTPAQVEKTARTAGQIAGGVDDVLSFIPGVGSIAHAVALGAKGGAALVEKGAHKLAAVSKHKARRANHKHKKAKAAHAAAEAKGSPDVDQKAAELAEAENELAEAGGAAVEAVEAAAAPSNKKMLYGVLGALGLGFILLRKK